MSDVSAARERIADALERIATAIDRGRQADDRSSDAMVLIRQVADELGAAAAALDNAAWMLKEKGAGVPASAAKQAASRAKKAQLGLVGTT